MTENTTTTEKSAYIGTSERTHRILAMLDAARITGKSPLLWGKPGVGKTALIRAYAEKHNLVLRTLIGSTMDPTEVEGLPVLASNENGDAITKNTVPEWADTFFREGKGVLFLDELSTTTPTVQAALLSLIQNRRVGQHTLPKEVFIVAAANDSKDAADGWLLAPPTANRFMHIEFDADFDDWCEGMRVAFGQDMTEAEQESRNLIVGFLQNHTKSWNAMPDDPESAGKAWPSPRSWDNTASVWGQITDRSTRRVVMRGFVGENAERGFDTWFVNLRLPDYNSVITAPEKLGWAKFKADEVYLILSMVGDRLSEDNMDKTLAVFLESAKAGRTDVAAAIFRSLLNKIGKIALETTKSTPAAIRAKALPAMKEFGVDLKRAGIN